MVVGLVGAGNMGGALARGWHAGDGGPDRLLISDVDIARARSLAAEVGGEVAGSNGDLAAGSDLVVLAVKPALLEAVAAEMEPRAVASILAGTTLARLQRAFPGAPIVRLMPNVAARVRRGSFCFAAGGSVDPSLRDGVVGLFALLGEVVELPEALLEAATALMGCGPAFVALVHEALVDAGVDEGLPAATASDLVIGTLAGTAALLRENGGDSLAIKRTVTSPGGATAAGLLALEQGGLRAALQEAVRAAASKAAGAGAGKATGR